MVSFRIFPLVLLCVNNYACLLTVTSNSTTATGGSSSIDGQSQSTASTSSTSGASFSSVAFTGSSSTDRATTPPANSSSGSPSFTISSSTISSPSDRTAIADNSNSSSSKYDAYIFDPNPFAYAPVSPSVESRPTTLTSDRTATSEQFGSDRGQNITLDPRIIQSPEEIADIFNINNRNKPNSFAALLPSSPTGQASQQLTDQTSLNTGTGAASISNMLTNPVGGAFASPNTSSHSLSGTNPSEATSATTTSEQFGDNFSQSSSPERPIGELAQTLLNNALRVGAQNTPGTIALPLTSTSQSSQQNFGLVDSGESILPDGNESILPDGSESILPDGKDLPIGVVGGYSPVDPNPPVTTLPAGAYRDEETGSVYGQLPPEGFLDTLTGNTWYTAAIVFGSGGGSSGPSGSPSVPSASDALDALTTSSSLSGEGAGSSAGGTFTTIDSSGTSSGGADGAGGSSTYIPSTTYYLTNAPTNDSGAAAGGSSGVDSTLNATITSGNSTFGGSGGTLGGTGSSIGDAAGQFGRSTTSLANNNLGNAAKTGGNSNLGAAAGGASDASNPYWNDPYAFAIRPAGGAGGTNLPPLGSSTQAGTVGTTTTPQNNTNGTQPADPNKSVLHDLEFNPEKEAKTANKLGITPIFSTKPTDGPSNPAGSSVTGNKFTDDTGQTIELDAPITLSDKSLADVFNRGNPVVTQTSSDGSVTLVDKTKQDIQNFYDGLSNLDFKDPAPVEPKPAATPKNTQKNDNPIDNVAKPDNSQPNYFEKPIKDWQNRLGVTADGLVGPETIHAGVKAVVNGVVDWAKNNPVAATKLVLSSLGLGGSPDPNPKASDSKTAQKIVQDALTKSTPQPVDVLGVVEVSELVSNIFNGITDLTGANRDFYAEQFAKGNGLAIIPGVINTMLDREHLPTTVLTLASLPLSSGVAATNLGKAVLTNPAVQSAFALDTGLNIGQAITGTDLQGNPLSGTDRFAKGASGVLGVLGLPGTAATAKNTSGIANDEISHSGGVLDDVSKTGETSSTLIGKTTHKTEADTRREMGEFSTVNSPITDKSGNDILVPKRVDLKTGQPQENTTPQRAIPDATIYNKGLIIDDKPLGRSIAKDRQEIIRFIKAFEIREGRLPSTIAIQRYDPKTGQPFVTEIYKPTDFLP